MNRKLPARPPEPFTRYGIESIVMQLKSSSFQADTITAENLTGRPLDELLDREWLLTNQRGGFSSGTLAGCNTRRYHGLLTGTLHPPASRIVSLSNLLESIVLPEDTMQFSCFEFDRAVHPRGFEYLTGFTRDTGIHFEYELGVSKLRKSIYLLQDRDCIAIRYSFFDLCREFEFTLRPLIAMRDFHALQQAPADLISEQKDSVLHIQSDAAPGAQLLLRGDGFSYQADPEWWYRFQYRIEQQRGMDSREDVWSPGTFTARVKQPRDLVIWAELTPSTASTGAFESIDLNEAVESLDLHEKQVTKAAYSRDPIQKVLFAAADQFLVQRTIDQEVTWTILAGYPWFLDWGRDTFIALPGLCLSTGRMQEAAGVLKTFAKAVNQGMIPNRFDDYGGAPHYNSIDASLWFVHGAFAYLQAGGDASLFEHKLLSAIQWIMEDYRKGTRFGIRADTDHLITGGTPDTQLTWMDAKCGDDVFTPRHGKAVEINALWYSNLCHLADYFKEKNIEQHDFYNTMARTVKDSFNRLFWNDQTGCLFDCIFPDETADASIRPNQIFAVSLPYSPLSANRQKQVVRVVQQELLTPYGLRSLSPRDPKYIGRYEGSGYQRDSAYHQGTVWPWLIGAFIEAHLKVHEHSENAYRNCASMLHALICHLTNSGCVGSISEVFDGDPPHRPGGCFAQAWSVAEVLRVWRLLQIHNKPA